MQSETLSPVLFDFAVYATEDNTTVDFNVEDSSPASPFPTSTTAIPLSSTVQPTQLERSKLPLTAALGWAAGGLGVFILIAFALRSLLHGRARKVRRTNRTDTANSPASTANSGMPVKHPRFQEASRPSPTQLTRPNPARRSLPLPAPTSYLSLRPANGRNTHRDRWSLPQLPLPGVIDPGVIPLPRGGGPSLPSPSPPSQQNAALPVSTFPRPSSSSSPGHTASASHRPSASTSRRPSTSASRRPSTPAEAATSPHPSTSPPRRRTAKHRRARPQSGETPFPVRHHIDAIREELAKIREEQQELARPQLPPPYEGPQRPRRTAVEAGRSTRLHLVGWAAEAQRAPQTGKGDDGRAEQDGKTRV